ncbi:hypothetical protein [Brucella pseudogrignonensis]|uniref:Glycosyl transferases group 1 family protein n=1 Tax=Brucella pseudogrignonensis TaxID=419475 RepID=A0ABU1MF44_9HYPH|nr:hypothetical protein [Brucella pseudogrignonensis]MDR6434674.1 hypothetical protein [Brucella pseudogrignonensis]
MRVLILGTYEEQKNIRNFEGLMSHYIIRALRNKGVELSFVDVSNCLFMSDNEVEVFFREADLKNSEHIIALGLRFFDKISPICLRILRERHSGTICQFYDGGILNGPAVDATFTFRDDSWRYPLNSPNNRHERFHNSNFYVGWAADSMLFSSNQNDDVLRVLVDHTSYDDSGWDISVFILQSLRTMVQSNVWKKRFKGVQIRQIVEGGVRDVDLNNICITAYGMNKIPIKKIAEEYSKSHLFMVTHKESLGISALEAAVAGGLPVIPAGFIPLDRTKTFRNFEYSEKINWEMVINCIDCKKSRSMSIDNSWNKLVDNVVSLLKSMT